MILERRLFYNRKNGQFSLTLPKDIIQKEMLKSTGKIPKNIFLKILSPNKVKDENIG